MQTVLSVEDLRKSYGKIAALKGVSFSVSTGTCFGLLGPNGAGKSTTMKILTGIVQADGGSAEILGLDVATQRDAIRRQVGYVPQSITLYEKLSAWDNLVFFGELYGVRSFELDARIREVLERMGLANRGKDMVEGFSGGMKRRVNIAVALLHRPKLLILDEPTVGIDPQSRNHIFEMIRSLTSEGVTVIYSTHYMEEVEALCDDVAIIDQGCVIAQGALRDVLTRHGTQAVYVESDGFERLPVFPQATSTARSGKGWVIQTPEVMNAMKHVLHSASEQGVELQALEIVRPSLESVFLSLTGTRLRD